MTIVKHRPQGQLISPFDEFFNSFFGRDLSHFIGSDDVSHNAPRVNITETKDAYRLEVLAPGFNKEELKMNIEDDMLTLSAERKTEKLDEGERYTRREFGFSSFTRSFRMPENVNTEAIKAEYVNGVLNVTVPKAEPAKPAVREISIN